MMRFPTGSAWLPTLAMWSVQRGKKLVLVPSAASTLPPQEHFSFLSRLTHYTLLYIIYITTNYTLSSRNYKPMGWAYNPLKNNYLSFSRFWMMDEYKNGGNWLEHIHASGGPLHYEGSYSRKLHRKLQQPILIVLFNFPKHFIFLKSVRKY